MLRDIICRRRTEGVIQNTVLVWGNHIPVTHREMASAMREHIGPPRGAGFYGLCEGVPKSSGKSVSLNLGNTDYSDKTFQAAHLGKFYKVNLVSGRYVVPCLLITDGDVQNIVEKDYKEIVGLEAIDAYIDELYSTYATMTKPEE